MRPCQAGWPYFRGTRHVALLPKFFLIGIFERLPHNVQHPAARILRMSRNYLIPQNRKRRRSCTVAERLDQSLTAAGSWTQLDKEYLVFA